MQMGFTTEELQALNEEETWLLEHMPELAKAENIVRVDTTPLRRKGVRLSSALTIQRSQVLAELYAVEDRFKALSEEITKYEIDEMTARYNELRVVGREAKDSYGTLNTPLANAEEQVRSANGAYLKAQGRLREIRVEKPDDLSFPTDSEITEHSAAVVRQQEVVNEAASEATRANACLDELQRNKNEHGSKYNDVVKEVAKLRRRLDILQGIKQGVPSSVKFMETRGLGN